MIILVIFVGALLQILSLFEVNITALIAGVSIGGLAIALAAQDAVKNFIGSIMIFADKPFQIGDYIVGSGFEGEVKEVGFRTTRIQALDTSIVAVPNGSIANMNIENKGVRVMRLFNTVINLTYESKPEQLKNYVSDLKQLIIDHPRVADENYYVHIKELANSSINVMFRAYLNVPGYADELALKEELIYVIMELAEKNGLDFAFPSQTVYMKKG
jgi:MscS family membrane protein